MKAFHQGQDTTWDNQSALQPSSWVSSFHVFSFMGGVTRLSPLGTSGMLASKWLLYQSQMMDAYGVYGGMRNGR